MFNIFNIKDKKKRYKELGKFKEKCNFFYINDNFTGGKGECSLGSSYLHSQDCEYEDCIFMKILNKEGR